MGKTIKYVLLTLIIIFSSCRSSKTPKEFIYTSKIDKEVYSSDSINLYKLCSLLLLQNIRPFNNTQIYNRKTTLYLDTIFYSPDFDRFVVFVIANPNYGKDNKDKRGKFYYGLHFDGYRNSHQELVINKSSWYEFSADNYCVLQELFYSYALIRKSTDRPLFGEPQYNMNDRRYWKSKEILFSASDSIHLVLYRDGKIVFFKQ